MTETTSVPDPDPERGRALGPGHGLAPNPERSLAPNPGHGLAPNPERSPGPTPGHGPGPNPESGVASISEPEPGPASTRAFTAVPAAADTPADTSADTPADTSAEGPRDGSGDRSGDAPGPRARRAGPSARARIVGWMLLLVGLALALSIFATWTVLLARLDDRVAGELEHEAGKLRRFAASGQVDPSTGARPEGVDGLLSAYLQQNVPDEHESFFSIVDGRADRRSSAPPPARLDTDQAFVARLARARTPESGVVASRAGTVHYAVMPVRMTGDPRPGALVVLEFRDLQRAEVTEATRVLAVTSFAALGVAGLAGWLVAGRVLAPIRMVRRTAERIGSSDLTERLTVTGNDDVAALARTFNRMLDRLEHAFATQRRFLDDAGHELRTPITVIRGHLEVMGDDPAERAEATALILDELERMRRIVDDLLVLARAERADFLTLGDVDLADLTVETVAKARALGDRRWRVGELAEVRVRADGQRLTQALMQLAENAVRHTRDGGTIEVGSAVHAWSTTPDAGGTVYLWVRDDGPGVPEADRERVFERFVRATRTGGDDEGAGLGLAIVASIAAAHGGRAYVTDRFVIEFPLRPAAPPGAGSPAAATLRLPVREP